MCVRVLVSFSVYLFVCLYVAHGCACVFLCGWLHVFVCLRMFSNMFASVCLLLCVCQCARLRVVCAYVCWAVYVCVLASLLTWLYVFLCASV